MTEEQQKQTQEIMQLVEKFIALANEISGQLDLPARMADVQDFGSRDTFTSPDLRDFQMTPVSKNSGKAHRFRGG